MSISILALLLITQGSKSKSTAELAEMTARLDCIVEPVKAQIQGKSVTLTVPLPVDDGIQSVSQIEAPGTPEFMRNPKTGQRTLAFRYESGTTIPDRIVIKMKVHRLGQDSLERGKGRLKFDPKAFEPFLAVDGNFALSAELKTTSDSIVAGAEETVEKARKIYDYLAGKMTIENDAELAKMTQIFTSRVGSHDPQIPSAIFVAFCRHQKIPARLVWGIRLPTEGDELNATSAHGWAQFFDGRYGWVSVDLSSATRKTDPRHANMGMGKLDPYRIAFPGKEWTTGKLKTDDTLSACSLTVDGNLMPPEAWKERWKFDYVKE